MTWRTPAMIYVAPALALAAGAVAALWLASARADTDSGRAAFRAADYPTALRELTPGAAAGEAEAAFTVGQMYAAGLGVPRDPLRAVELFRTAAAKGHAESQYSLGAALFHGEGAPQDMAEGLKWLVVAALAGQAKAREFLDRVRPRVTSALMAEAQRRAHDWRGARPQASETGEAPGPQAEPPR
jgi:TPR repeat protein